MLLYENCVKILLSAANLCELSSVFSELFCFVLVAGHAINKRESVRTVFVDFAKAFDRVDHNPHNVLVAKLVTGLPDVIARWMTVFLQERPQCVKIGDCQICCSCQLACHRDHTSAH